MKAKEAELIVKTVLAGISAKYGVADIESQRYLYELGIDAARANEFKKLLLTALSGTEKPDPTKFFTSVKITPTSSVKAVAKELPKAYKASLSAGSAFHGGLQFEDPGKSNVEMIVCTSLAQNSSKYSVGQIRPEMKLADLGIDLAGMARAKTGIYRSFRGRSQIKLEDYIGDPSVKATSTVGDLVKASIAAFSLSGDDTTTDRG